MESKTIEAPEGYKITSVQIVDGKLIYDLEPVKKKYPTEIREIEKKWLVGETYQAKRYNDNSNHCASQERAEQFAAMMQVVCFMDEWNRIDGFKPDWSNEEQKKWYICLCSGGFEIDYNYTVTTTLAFGSKETAELFLETFKPLIIKAGDLI